MSGVTGGEKAVKVLAEIGKKLSVGKQPTVQVGFLGNKTYPETGESVAYIAFINEFGARIEREPTTTTVYRKLNKDGTGFAKQGKFVKKSKADFASDHYVGAHVINIPPRPFFRNMIAQYGNTWGEEIAKRLEMNDYDVNLTLSMMGELIVGQLRQSINDLWEPPNAPSTIAKKGHDKPLIDTGFMWNSAEYNVINT